MASKRKKENEFNLDEKNAAISKGVHASSLAYIMNPQAHLLKVLAPLYFRFDIPACKNNSSNFVFCCNLTSSQLFLICSLSFPLLSSVPSLERKPCPENPNCLHNLNQDGLCSKNPASLEFLKNSPVDEQRQAGQLCGLQNLGCVKARLFFVFVVKELSTFFSFISVLHAI